MGRLVGFALGLGVTGANVGGGVGLFVDGAFVIGALVTGAEDTGAKVVVASVVAEEDEGAAVSVPFVDASVGASVVMETTTGC